MGISTYKTFINHHKPFFAVFPVMAEVTKKDVAPVAPLLGRGGHRGFRWTPRAPGGRGSKTGGAKPSETTRKKQPHIGDTLW
jgi:hypothetical protein